MTVPAYTGPNTSVANGVTTTFPYGFKVLAETDLLVTVNGLPRTLGTHYTVTGVGNDSGGNVVFGTPPAVNTVVARLRNMPYSRDTNYQNLGDLLADTLNADQDAPIMMIQQLAAGSLQLEPDPESGGFAWNARGSRIIRVGDPIGGADAANLQSVLRLLEQAQEGGGQGVVVAPRIWQFDGDGSAREFGIPGADVDDPLFYDVFLQRAGQEPYDDFSIVMGLDTSDTLLRFAVAPANGTTGWVVLRGYARPYQGEAPVTTLDIPIIDVPGPAAVVDSTSRWSLLDCHSDLDTLLTIRQNTGSAVDWRRGRWFSARQVGAGQVSIAGANIQPLPGFLAKTRGAGSIITCTCVDASSDTWAVSGDLVREAANPELQALSIEDRSVLIGTNIAAGTGKASFVMPFGLLLSPVAQRGIYASLAVAQTAGTVLTVDVNRNGVSILNLKLTFDNNEKTTLTAALPPTFVAGGDVLFAGDEITIDVDQIGTAGAKGLTVYLVGQRA